MSGLDIEGVLAGHRRECADEWCGERWCGWLVPEDAEDFAAAHRAHVAVVVSEQIAAWLGSETVVDVARAAAYRWADTPHVEDSPFAAALSALAALVAPSRVPGEESCHCDRTESALVQCPIHRVPGEET